MRFIVMVKATKESESGVMPSEKLLAEMGKFNEELVKAGIMLAAEGLHPSSKGVRVKLNGSKRTVVDGPFAKPGTRCRLLAVVQVDGRGDRVGQALPESVRARRAKSRSGVFEAEDFGAEFTRTARAEARQRAKSCRSAALGALSANDSGEWHEIFQHLHSGCEDQPGPPADRQGKGAMDAFVGDAIKRGEFLSGGGFGSLAQNSAVVPQQQQEQRDQRAYVESKELIGSFACSSTPRRRAIDSARRFLEVAGDGECVYQIEGGKDC
jgi:hypothetical protein